MGLFAALNMVIYFIVGTIFLIYVATTWKEEQKRPYRYSELIYGIFFYLIGLIFYFFLDVEGIAGDVGENVQKILFFFSLAIFAFLYPLNLWREWYKCYKNPDLIQSDPLTRVYSTFLEQQDELNATKTKSDDLKKDLSRKILHFIMFGILIGVHIWSSNLAVNHPEWQLTPVAIRNTIYLLVAPIFLLMFTSADLYRLKYYHCCPDWARNWFGQSLDLNSERWTIISSGPFLQTMLLFIFAPVQVLFSAGIVSCIADSVASIVGKSMGKHKITQRGYFPNKSYEGLAGGAITAFIGVMLVFTFYPLPTNNLLIAFSSALIAAFAFMFIDVWGKMVADNILNTLIPGVFIWGFLLIFA